MWCCCSTAFQGQLQIKYAANIFQGYIMNKIHQFCKILKDTLDGFSIVIRPSDLYWGVCVCIVEFSCFTSAVSVAAPCVIC